MSSTDDAAAAAAANTDDAEEARKIVAMEQLTEVYGFDKNASEQALDNVGADIQAAVRFIIESGLGKDRGGSVLPKEDCPHINKHVKLTVEELPAHPQNSKCSVFRESSGDGAEPEPESTGQPKSEGPDQDGSCPGDENWLCLECGVVRCSRYGNGHGLEHWKDTHQEAEDAEGHCVAASLADLSVWCYECDSYVRNPVLDPLLQKLEQLKFQDIQHEPKKKKAKQSHSHENDDKPSAGAQSSGDEAETNNGGEVEDGDSDDSGGGGPTIIDIARAVARGIPYELFQAEDDDQELEYPFDTLPTSLAEVASFILSEKCQRIAILAGAGMSVAAGIPDFRSADGLYKTMQPQLLSCNPVEREAITEDPTVALEQGMFLQNPLPCLELNREFILGTCSQRWKATIAHRFVELLHHKTGKLVRLYTQNIDGAIEDQCTQLPRDKVIAVHGSMDRAACAQCGEQSDYAEFCDQVRTQIKDLSGKDPCAPQESTPITCTNCERTAMKPDIVLFRSSLPATFFENVPRDVLDVDLLIVMGTSLRVAPANSLVWRVPKTAMRLLVNREPVGWHLGVTYGQESTRDVFAQGNCDTILLELMSHMGWLKDLEPLLAEQKLPQSSAALLSRKLGPENADCGNGTTSESSSQE